MPTIATGVFKTVAIKRQASQGVQAPAGAAGTARYMRRTSSTMDLAKAGYGSAEILPSQQTRDFRHGVRSVAGSLAGELSVGGYQLPFENVLRKLAAAGATTGVIANLTFASSGVGTFAGTITRAAGDFLAEGFKVGEVVRPAGAGVGAMANVNLLVTALTATVMTVRRLDGLDVTAVAAAADQTVAMAGKKVFIPATGQIRDYLTVEHFYSDIAKSEQYIDTQYTGFTVTLPASGLATVEFPAMGLDMKTSNAQYFTAPAAAPAGAILAAVNGVIIVAGQVVANVTGLTITAAGGNTAPGGVVGSNVDPDIFPGTLGVTGSATVLFSDTVLRDLFINETEYSIVGVFTGDNSPGAGFEAFHLPRVKATGNTKDDVATGISQTIPFQALENVLDSTRELTTVVVQDSAFA